MDRVNEEVIASIIDLQANVRSLDTSDPESVVNVGIALEKLLTDSADELSDATDLVELCLSALQSIYEDTSVDASRVVSGLGAAIDALVSVVQLDEGCDSGFLVRTACSALWMAMGKDPAACPYIEITSNAAPTGIDALNNAAADLVQLDSSDVDGLSSLRDNLRIIAEDRTIDLSIRKYVFDAVDVLDGFASGKTGDFDCAIADAGSLIETAMNTAEDMEEGMPADGKSPEPKHPEPVVVASPEPVPVAQQTVVDPEPAVSSVRPDTLPADFDADLLNEFITECGEYIESSESALLTLETEPEDDEAVNTVFRAFHTIKGTSAFLGLNNLSELAHKAESLLSRVRDREIKCTGGYADLALRSIDMLTAILEGVKEALGGSGVIPVPPGFSELIDLLSDPEAGGVSEESMFEDAPRLGDLLVAEGAAEREAVESVAEQAKSGRLGEALVKTDTASLADVAKALRTQKKITNSSNDKNVESSVRVRTDRLDRLIDMVGELVIAQSITAQDETVIMSGNHELAKKVIHMGKIVRDLQYLSMSMRMVPMKPTFQKMARLVRDVAQKSGKIVEFVTEGEDTEIDRNMVDIIGDPLVHMIRNAVDHGIETPADRLEKGKLKTGRVSLSAYHAGGNVVVEMRDDGKGLNKEKIVEKAIARGLIESDKGMTDYEIYNLIFEPGFSTADKVTDISGRGVGLDVVRKNIESVRGRVEIMSEPGQGCVFTLRLPLTMAVTDGMLVRVGDEKFIIPTISIHMSFRPEPDAISTVTGRGELVMLRGEIMPIFRLHRLFGISGAVDDPQNALLVILDDGDKQCALLVDELLGQHHVVAKSLGAGIGKIRGISGGAILGDGRVGLIIDVSEIISLARQSADTSADMCFAA